MNKHNKKPPIPRPIKEEKRYVRVQFNSFALPFANFLRKHNYAAGFSTRNNLSKLLTHRSSSNTPLEKRTGVYSIKYSTCEEFDIGQTGRSFGKRFKEHLTGKNLAKITSNFARHLVDRNHNYVDFSTNCIPLHTCGKGQVMNTL